MGRIANLTGLCFSNAISMFKTLLLVREGSSKVVQMYVISHTSLDQFTFVLLNQLTGQK